MSSSPKESDSPRLVTVKELAKIYGLNKTAIYGFISTDPSFPYVNVGLKKKFVIDLFRFESWLQMRTTKQKQEFFNIPNTQELLNIFNNKKSDGTEE